MWVPRKNLFVVYVFTLILMILVNLVHKMHHQENTVVFSTVQGCCLARNILGVFLLHFGKRYTLKVLSTMFHKIDSV